MAVVILAAGQGTRMNSSTPKVLHEAGGKAMIRHVFEAAQEIADLPPVIVISPDGSRLSVLFGDNAHYVEQPRPLGTGDAARAAQPLLENRAELVLVTYADMPLLRAATMRRLAAAQEESGAAVALLSVIGDPGSTFGRVVRDDRGQVREIVEVAEARRRPDAAALLAINELNAGVYCFDGRWLWQTIGNLPVRQARGGEEYYLTDLIEAAVKQKRGVVALAVEDPDECMGAGTRAELAAVEKAFRRRANRYWLDHGVTLIDPDSTYIDQDVTIGADTIIWPNTYLQGKTCIGESCVLGPNTIIRQAELGDGCHVEQAVVERVTLPDGTVVNPFSCLSGDNSSPPPAATMPISNQES